MRKGFQGNCNYFGKHRPALERVLVEGSRTRKPKEEDLGAKREEEKGGRGRDLILTVSRSTLEDLGTTQQKEVLGEGGKGRGNTGKSGTYWLDGVSAQGADLNGGGAWHGVSSNLYTFLGRKCTPQDWNRRTALQPLIKEILMMRSLWCLSKTFPIIQETDFENNKRQRVGRGQPTALHEVKQEVNGEQELYPLSRVEEHDGQPRLHAVSDSSRWMSTCPLTGLTEVRSVLDSGATDSCATD